MEPTQLAFIILGASMAALALMILVVAVLATGATRHEVYKSSVGRVGGRIGNIAIKFNFNFSVVLFSNYRTYTNRVRLKPPLKTPSKTALHFS